MCKFSSCRCPVLVHQVYHARLTRHVTIIAKMERRIERNIGIIGDFDILSANHTPTDHGLHLTHGGYIGWGAIGDTGTVWHLIEPVRCRNRPEQNRFKQNLAA